MSRFATVCRRHPDVVAIHEAPDGRLALLLRQTLVPLHEERGRWLNETRRVARAAVSSLRAAGVTEDVTVLQWRRLDDVAHILACWSCRYLADPVRHAQLTDIVATRLIDRAAAALPPPGAGAPAAGPGSDALAISSTLIGWYRDMAPCWLDGEPPIRRRLILRTHRWIVERVLGPMARGERPTVEDLEPTGRLAWMLVRVVPHEELDAWKPWIRLTLGDLQRAMAWPAARRNEAWVRWLFVIPYSIPVTGRRRVRTIPHSADRPGGAA